MPIPALDSGAEYPPEGEHVVTSLDAGQIPLEGLLAREPKSMRGAPQLADLPQPPLRTKAESPDRPTNEVSLSFPPNQPDTGATQDHQRLIALCTYDGVFDQELYNFIVKTQRGRDTISEKDCNQIKYWCTGKDGKLNRTFVGYVVEAQVLSHRA